VRVYEDVLRKDGVKRCLQVLEAKQNEWKSRKVNIAITGRSGTGKSSFINALVEKWTGKKGPAKAGIKETTVECGRYEHPNNPNIVLWDLPGLGTGGFPAEDYLSRVNVQVYDVFIIMTADRFTEQDTRLGEELMKRNAAIIFVRTKISQDVANSKRDFPEKDERTVLKEVKNYMIDKSSKFLKGFGVFLIDNHHFDKYNFRDLEKCMLDKISVSQGQALILSISNMSKVNLDLKITELKNQIVTTALRAALVGTLPFFQSLKIQRL